MMTRIPAARRSRLLSNIGAFTAAAMLTSFGAAAAQPAVASAPIAVHYTAGDLVTDGGLRALYSRIAHAAEQVCPPYIHGGLAFEEEHRVVDACRRQAVARAIRQIGNPRLAALVKRVAPVG